MASTNFQLLSSTCSLVPDGHLTLSSLPDCLVLATFSDQRVLATFFDQRVLTTFSDQLPLSSLMWSMSLTSVWRMTSMWSLTSVVSIFLLPWSSRLGRSVGCCRIQTHTGHNDDPSRTACTYTDRRPGGDFILVIHFNPISQICCLCFMRFEIMWY